MATAKKSAAAAATSALFRPNMSLLLDDIEQEQGEFCNSLSVEQVSTGLLSVDALTFGGFCGGAWATVFGPEQSGKSTFGNELSAHHVGEALESIYLTEDMREEYPFIPANVICDAEGSYDFDPNGLFMNAVRKHSFDPEPHRVFGLRNPKGGWEYEPLVRWHKLPSMEFIFDFMHATAKSLPDVKTWDGKDYYVYDMTTENKTAYGKFADKALSKKKLWIPLPDGLRVPMQALFNIDSYSALLPQSMDDDSANKQMALMAREFAKHIPRIRGFMRGKRIVIAGVNQFRDRPGVPPTQYEPNGGALRFASDLRLRANKVSPSTVGDGHTAKKGSYELVEEPSVLYPGANDVYSFVKLTTAKNKLGGLDKLSVTLRLWRASGDSTGWGFCPAYDAYKALQMAGKIECRSRNQGIRILAFGLEHATKKLTWSQFKILCLYPNLIGVEAVEQVLDEIGLPAMEAFDLRYAIRQKIMDRSSGWLNTLKANVTGYKSAESTEVEDSDQGVDYARETGLSADDEDCGD